VSARPRQGAIESRRSLRERLQAWHRHHRMSARQSLGRLLREPSTTVLTWLVIGIALALPAGLLVTLDNLQRVSGGWEAPGQLSLFLGDAIAQDAAEALASRIAGLPLVSEVELLAPEQALAEFAALSGIADVLGELERNPLPFVILVLPHSPADSADLQAVLAAEAGVQEVVLDREWLQRLQALLALGRQLVVVLAVLLLSGVLLSLGNTLRLAIESRRDEIVVIKLVGGSDAFVRRPFLYTGIWYGLGGGVMAVLTLAAALGALRGPVQALATSYGSQFTLAMPGIFPALGLLALAAGLGLAGAALAVRRHIAAIEPR
jgi:cell division transport system permease protein